MFGFGYLNDVSFCLFLLFGFYNLVNLCDVIGYLFDFLFLVVFYIFVIFGIVFNDKIWYFDIDFL